MEESTDGLELHATPMGIEQLKAAWAQTPCHICGKLNSEPGEWYCSAGHPIGESPTREQMLEDDMKDYGAWS